MEERRLEGRRLLKKYNIMFRGPVPPEQWPPSHKATFKDIHDIGNSHRYETYAASIDIQSGQRPWRKEIKNRTKIISELAMRSYNEGR